MVLWYDSRKMFVCFSSPSASTVAFNARMVFNHNDAQSCVAALVEAEADVNGVRRASDKSLACCW